MNSKSLSVLVVVFVVLSGVFFLQSSQTSDEADNRSRRLFQDVQQTSGDITQIDIRQGESEFRLARDGQEWVIPSRQGYPADAGKVKSLLIKVLGLDVSQVVTKRAENFEKLGVTDEAVSKGKGAVFFKNEKGEEIVGIYLGDFRKKQHTSGLPAPLGQYVRRTDEETVYLISDPISVVTTLTYWLDTTIANKLQSNILSIEQFALSEDGEELLYSFQRKEKDGPLQLEQEVPAGKKLKDVNVNQVRSSLENVRLEDVFRADAEQAKALNFDYKTRFLLSNGLIYEVASAKDDEKFYAKIAVSFDEAYGEKVSAEHEAETEENKDAAETDGEAQKPKGPELSSAAEAKKLMEQQYSKWIFVLPQYLGQKFRHTLADLFEAKSKEASA